MLNGTVKPNDTEWPSKQILQGVNKLQDLTETEQERRIQHYFKFSFIRNPLERIVSAYHNKIAVPINYTNRFYWPDCITISSKDMIKNSTPSGQKLILLQQSFIQALEDHKVI